MQLSQRFCMLWSAARVETEARYQVRTSEPPYTDGRPSCGKQVGWSEEENKGWFRSGKKQEEGVSLSLSLEQDEGQLPGNRPGLSVRICRHSGKVIGWYFVIRDKEEK